MNNPIKPGGRFFRYRNGMEGFYWKGMATKTDPGAQPPDRPRLVLNGRYVGGHIVARPDISAAPVAAVPQRSGIGGLFGSWHPAFLTQQHSYAGIRLWFGARPPSSGMTGEFVGGTIGFIDTDWDKEYKDVANYYHPSSFTPIVEKFANFIYVGDYEALRRLYRVDPPVAQAVEEYEEKTPADEIVASYPGFMTTALFRHDNKLFFALADPTGTANGFIYSWDGYGLTQEYNLTVPGTSGVAMYSFRNTLVVTVRGLGSILVRSVTGAWSTATVGGFDSSGYMNSMAEVGSKLYIANGGDKIYTWDGTTLALAQTILGGTSPTRCNCLARFNGRLYYLWAEDLGGNSYWPWLGVFDPDTINSSYKWKDDYKSFGTSDGNVAVVDGHDTGGDHPYMLRAEPTAMAVYRQRLIVAIQKDHSLPSYTYTTLRTHSVENNPYSDWHVIHPNTWVQDPTGPLYLPSVGNQISMQYLKVF